MILSFETGNLVCPYSYTVLNKKPFIFCSVWSSGSSLKAAIVLAHCTWFRGRRPSDKTEESVLLCKELGLVDSQILMRSPALRKF